MIRARRLSTAKHEAGHVIPMLALSLPFKNVEIIPGEITIDTPNMGFVLDRGDLCLGVVRTDAVAWIVGGCQMNAEDRIMQSLAGVAGEQIDWKRPVFGRGDWVGRSLGDMADAEAYADLLDLVSLKPLFDRAWKLLRRYRKAHAALVEALLEKSLLTYEDCVAIWDGRLELYQRIQRREVFEIGSTLATFVATPADETLFVGLYLVDGIGVAPPGTIDPVIQAERAGFHLYDIRREELLSDYAGHLIIDWGKGFRSWVQRADRRDKLVLEIREEVREQPFPGFTQFCWDIDQINAVPLRWQEVLRSVKGVYLLVCNETGKQYVGSAKGEESLWGRFLEYARTGHGGNVELRRRGSKGYRVTVLEVVNSDTGIERVEEAWKQKLMSRKFGLNKN